MRASLVEIQRYCLFFLFFSFFAEMDLLNHCPDSLLPNRVQLTLKINCSNNIQSPWALPARLHFFLLSLWRLCLLIFHAGLLCFPASQRPALCSSPVVLVGQIDSAVCQPSRLQAAPQWQLVTGHYVTKHQHVNFVAPWTDSAAQVDDIHFNTSLNNIH